jgi:RNA polymerase sigma factor (TIGR02999 family)
LQGDSTQRDAPGGEAGDRGRPSPFTGEIYCELRRIAGGLLRGERAGHSLQPTALVHEAFPKLERADGISFSDQAHLLAVAATAMRQILVDHARARATAKRGGKNRRVTVDLSVFPEQSPDVDVLALHDTLDRLRELDERKARVIELRFFGGLELTQVAEVLGISRSTVAEDWRFSRAWIVRELEHDGAG